MKVPAIPVNEVVPILHSSVSVTISTSDMCCSGLQIISAPAVHVQLLDLVSLQGMTSTEHCCK